ncbi:hypothetical protein DL770_008833 [Monosporascus sp. CRB-9-2]|nr:hypothetical protein DL770_008833 [Monosporascus sp. CRB-9-2]
MGAWAPQSEFLLPAQPQFRPPVTIPAACLTGRPITGDCYDVPAYNQASLHRAWSDMSLPAFPIRLHTYLAPASKPAEARTSSSYIVQSTFEFTIEERNLCSLKFILIVCRATSTPRRPGTQLLDMPSYYFTDVKSRPSREYEFVRSKSFSFGHREHHHHHDRHHYRRVHICPKNCAGISFDEWNAVVRENRSLSTLNESTTRQNESLKCDLRNAKEEIHRLNAANKLLSEENEQLRCSLSHDGENAEKFRRRVAAMKIELEKKDHTIYHLEDENTSLAAKIRELNDASGKIAELASEVSHWKKRSAETLDMVKRFETGYDRVLRDLDKKEALIDQYRHKIRHLEGLLPRSSCVRVL